jgi:hypothetical protein
MDDATQLGIILKAIMLVPPTVGTSGLILSFLSLVPMAIWLILIARGLFQLGNGVPTKDALRS